VPRASVARGNTIISKVNKIRRNKGPEYNHSKQADREFWNQTQSPAEYDYLLKRVHKNQELGDYFDKELRYVDQTEFRKRSMVATICTYEANEHTGMSIRLQRTNSRSL
jgi:hypothetical protein